MGRTEEIEQRAYELWEAEGKPDGMAAEHWCRAREEVDGVPGASAKVLENANAKGSSSSTVSFR